ncbi:DUF5671 domain-containing protein [Salinibacterium sp. SYSU T00001]|uniref:DUF5671 domain-containing protein n=1 Tax=Homoserinimonas sedimenticola TaxID=2986805 RepID=UPI0022364030|nr:DUF5671 domain-containing protein [Salinibacterium sedimenticola]MCW4384977.1 DUF5671 domain-containing protein [Salinibacterium sedimenticola]
MPQRADRAPGGIHTLRRVIMLLLLAILVSVAAAGATGLLGIVLDPGTVLEDNGYFLAQSVASVVIAAPLGALVYWLTLRWLARFDDRRSVLWPVYLAVVGTVALLVGLTAMLATLADAVSGEWRPDSFALGLVWLAVWAWHAWMWHSPRHAPTRLAAVSPSLAVLVGIGFAIAGVVSALGVLFRSALLGSTSLLVGADHWWMPVLQQLVWAAGGALVWAWHWWGRGIRRSSAAFARFTLVVVSGFLAAAVTLGGLASLAYCVLALTLGVDGSAFAMARESRDLLDQLATAVAAAVSGVLVWAMHRAAVADATTSVRWSARLVASGVALAFAASGFGVVVNAGLAALSGSLAGDERSLLFGGLAALVVGALAWVVLWRPHDPGDETPGESWTAFAGRRAYLVIVFGVSALVAVVTLLVIAYGIVQSVIGVPWSESIIESIRQPLGLLTATALVAVYHFVVWRRSAPYPGLERAAARIEHVTLVAAGVTDALVEQLRTATGAKITVWAPHDEYPPADAAALVRALDEVRGEHVLVVTTSGGVEVVRLAAE